jgi:hypothetical protein
MAENFSEETDEKEQEVGEDELQLVKNIFTSFTKTIKTFTAYPKDNPIYQKFSSELQEKFEEFFSEHESLDLDIEQMSALYRGKVVFQSDDRHSNIAFLLYLDGIRKISFLKGLELEEIIDFIDVLRLNPNEENAEDDIVTLLWEKDIEHFSYYVPEQVGHTELALESEIFPEIDEQSGSDSGTGLGAGSGTGSGTGSAAHGKLTIGQTDIAAAPVGKEEALELREEVDRITGEIMLSTLIDLFIDLTASEEDISYLEIITKSLTRAIELMAQNDDLKKIIQVLKRLKSLHESVRSTEKKALIEEIITKAGSPENLRRFSTDGADLDMLFEFVSLLNVYNIQDLIGLLGEAEDRKLRKMLCGAMVPFAREDPEPFQQAILDDRWFLVRNIVTILGDSKNPEAAGILERAVAHNEERVRLAVLRALRSIGSEEITKPLIKMLEDPVSSIRINTLKTLLELKAPELYTHILSNVQAPEFHKSEAVEKKVFLEALGLTGGEEAFATLSGIFKKKSLFHREDNAKLRACAAYGLGHIGSPEAIDLLKKGAKSKNSTIKQACNEALERAGVDGEN